MYCIVCGKELQIAKGEKFFTCKEDDPDPVRMVDKNFCNTCGAPRTGAEPRKFTQCDDCYKSWVRAGKP